MFHTPRAICLLISCLVFVSLGRAETARANGTTATPSLTDTEMASVKREVEHFFAGFSAAAQGEDPVAQLRVEVEAVNGGPLAPEQEVELERFREELGLVLALVRLSPRAVTTLDRRDVDLVHRRVVQATPEGLFLLRRELEGIEAWHELTARLQGLDLHGLRALARHGPLDDADRQELGAFREEILGLVGSLHDVPGQRFDARTVEELAAKLRGAPDSWIFALRGEIDPTGVRDARHGVRGLARFGALDASGREELEGLRERVRDVYTTLAETGTADGDPQAGNLDRLSFEQLALLEAKLGEAPAWGADFATLARIFQSPEVIGDLVAVRDGDIDLQRDLRAFRQTSIAALYAQLQQQQAVGDRSVEHVVDFLKRASDEHLVIYRRAMADRGNEGDALSLTKTIEGFGSINLPSIPGLNMSCGIPDLSDFDPCRRVSNFLNNLLINRINQALRFAENGINQSLQAIASLEDEIGVIDATVDGFETVIGGIGSAVATVEGAILDLEGTIDDLEVAVAALDGLFDGVVFDTLLPTLLEPSFGMITTSLEHIGGFARAIDLVLSESVSTIRVFVDDVKRPFFDMIDRVGDPAGESLLLNELDGFMFNRDPAMGPLGLVTCMERALCAETEIVPFEVILPDGSTEIRQEQLCRRGKYIPLVGAVGSPRSVFACMVIKNEVNFFKNLMPEDALPGGKVADVVLNTFMHKLDQLCHVNDWMAGNRQLLLDRITLAERNARFQRLLGTCTLDGTDLSCPDLPAGQSLASLLGDTHGAVLGVGTSVDAVARDLDGLDQAVGGVGAQIDGVAFAVDGLGADLTEVSVQLDTGLTTTQTSLSTQLDDLQSLDLQLEIESNLAAIVDNRSRAVSLFMLPAASGGMLETVRDLVETVIGQAEVAGLTIGNARQYFQMAQGNVASRRYRAAYYNFALAYNEVVQPRADSEG